MDFSRHPLFGWLRELRRELHRRPETAFNEIEMSVRIRATLQALGIEPQKVQGPAVVTVGKFAGGSAANIIPDKVELQGTLRSFSGDVRELIIGRLNELIAGLRTMFRVETEFEFIEGVAACDNSAAVSEALYDAAVGVVGKKKVSFIDRCTGGEDFALFSEQVPGALMRLGCTNPAANIFHPLHSSRFDIDERVLPFGVEIISRAVVDYLS